MIIYIIQTIYLQKNLKNSTFQNMYLDQIYPLMMTCIYNSRVFQNTYVISG